MEERRLKKVLFNPPQYVQETLKFNYFFTSLIVYLSTSMNLTFKKKKWRKSVRLRQN